MMLTIKPAMYDLILMTLITISSCSSPKPLIGNEIRYIAFGNGGGFIGIETKYILNTGGTLTKIFNKDTTTLKSIDKTEAATLLKAAMAFKTYRYFKPDNLYQFIEIEDNRIVWNSNTDSLDNKITSLYTELLSQIK
jgi:hypothetical protein